MSVQSKPGTRSGKGSDKRNLLLAQKALTLTKWQWFADAGICRTRDEFEIIPGFLIGLYLAQNAGMRLSKTECCRLMKVDRAVTGPSYIARLAERGMVTIQQRSAGDRRKDLVIPTKRLLELVEAELPQTAKLLAFLFSASCGRS